MQTLLKIMGSTVDICQHVLQLLKFWAVRILTEGTKPFASEDTSTFPVTKNLHFDAKIRANFLESMYFENRDLRKI